MSAGRAAARNKPVIVVKAGRAPEGARAAASHTGALSSADAVIDAALRRAGMLRVDTLEDLFDAAETVAHARPLRGERLAIVTNGGGAGVLAADALSLQGGTLAALSDATKAALDAQLPATWSHGNPIDLIGDAPIERYTAALATLLAADEVDAVLFMHAPTAVVPSLQIAQACIPLMQRGTKPVLSLLARRRRRAGGGAGVRGRRRAHLRDARARGDRLRAPRAVPAQPGGAAADAAIERAAVRRPTMHARGQRDRRRAGRGTQRAQRGRGQGVARRLPHSDRADARRALNRRGRCDGRRHRLPGGTEDPVAAGVAQVRRRRRRARAGRRGGGAARRAGDGRTGCRCCAPMRGSTASRCRRWCAGRTHTNC